MTADADIDHLSSISEDVLLASGIFGAAYALQLNLARAQRDLDWQVEQLYDQIRQEERQARGIGSLTPAHERVEADQTVKALRKAVAERTAEVTAKQAELGGIVFLPAITNLPKIEKKLTAYNRKAKSIGTGAITLTKTEETLLLKYAYAFDGERAHSADFAHVFCVLAGETPKIKGFDFLASIVPTDAGNIVNRIPTIRYQMQHGGSDASAEQALNAIDLTRFHTTGATCEHCNKIRSRKDCYVVYNETTGEALQVGRSCLRDYMGSNNPEAVLKALEMYQELAGSFGARSESEALTTMTFLKHCAAVLRSSSDPYKLGGRATTNIWNQARQTKDSRTGEKLWVDLVEADETAAKAILHWAREELAEPTDFEQNVKIALANDFVEDRFVGIAGAAFISRDKWLKTAEFKAKKAADQAEATPVIEGRIVVTGEIIKAQWREGYAYNSEVLKLTVRDDRGFKLWGTCPTSVESEAERGARITFTASVTKSDDDETFGFFKRPTKPEILEGAHA